LYTVLGPFLSEARDTPPRAAIASNDCKSIIMIIN
jgi:hypothetical protein